MTTEEIKNTITYKMVSDEARELSLKLCNAIFVIVSNDTLYTSLNANAGQVLSKWKEGNLVY